MMTAMWGMSVMRAMLSSLLVLSLCSHLVQGATTMSDTTTAGSMGTTQTMTTTNQSNSPSTAAATAAMSSTASNTATTQAASKATAVTTGAMTTAGASVTTNNSTVQGTNTPAPNTTGNAASTMSGTAGMTDGMMNTTTQLTTVAAMPGVTTTGTMNNTGGSTSTTMNATGGTPTMAGNTDTMNTKGSTPTMAGTSTGTMNTTGGTPTMAGTSAGTMNATAGTPTMADVMMNTTHGTTAMPSTTRTMNTTMVTVNATSEATGAPPGTAMNTTMPESTTSLTPGTPEATGTMTTDNNTMAETNTTMATTTQAMTNSMTTVPTTAVRTTPVPVPYTWNVTFDDANCTVALDNAEEFLRNCSVAVASWLNVRENLITCRNITCGSTNVIVEVDPSADSSIVQKFDNLNNETTSDPLKFSFGGTPFKASAAEFIGGPSLLTTPAPAVPTTASPTPSGSFCMIRGLDYTGCLIFLCGVIATGVILICFILWGVIRCCRRQKSKSFDLISDIPHISLSDYPMTTIPRPSVYQHGNSAGQDNTAYITDDDCNKAKPPLESSNTSQSSRSSGRGEDQKDTGAAPPVKTDDSSNHVQPEIGSPSATSFQPREVATEEQPPPVYSPQSGTNNVVVQPTGTDQAPGPSPSPASPVTEENKPDMPETTDDYEVPASEEPSISFRQAPSQESTPPTSPKVIKGEDGSVSVVVNW